MNKSRRAAKRELLLHRIRTAKALVAKAETRWAEERKHIDYHTLVKEAAERELARFDEEESIISANEGN